MIGPRWMQAGPEEGSEGHIPEPKPTSSLFSEYRNKHHQFMMGVEHLVSSVEDFLPFLNDEVVPYLDRQGSQDVNALRALANRLQRDLDRVRDAIKE